MRTIIYTILLGSIGLTACVKEQDMTPDCAKWAVEINNPEATVTVKDGRLIIDIPNPKSFTDVRLIQPQQQGELHPEVGVWLNGYIETASLTEEKAYAEMRFSFGYEASAGVTFIGMAINSDGHRKGYVNERSVYSSKSGQYFYYASGTSAVFEPNHEINPVEIPQVSAAAKSFYMDFGVDPAIAHLNPIASLHAEVDFVKFGDHVLTPFDESELKDEDKHDLGFWWDDFECNSLIN